MKRILGQAKVLADNATDHHKAHRLVSEVIDKVIVHPEALELRLRRAELGRLLGAETQSEDPTHVVTSPCKLARRGLELKFILPLLDDTNTFGRRDPALIEAVAKAHLWWHWIKTGEMSSLSEIARREGIDKPKVTRLLRLAFLSPRLVRQIRDGSQPVGVTVTTLTRAEYLPPLWEEQDTIVASFQ
jgi:hypothetical protein